MSRRKQSESEKWGLLQHQVWAELAKIMGFSLSEWKNINQNE